MSIIFNSGTPAAAATFKNIQWQVDGSGNVSGEYDARFPIGVFNASTGANAAVLYYGIVPFNSTFLPGASASVGAARISATSAATYSFLKGTVTVATAVFSASAATATWAQAATVTFNGTSEILQINGPTSADATLADFSLTWVGYKN